MDLAEKNGVCEAYTVDDDGNVVLARATAPSPDSDEWKYEENGKSLGLKEFFQRQMFRPALNKGREIKQMGKDVIEHSI